MKECFERPALMPTTVGLKTEQLEQHEIATHTQEPYDSNCPMCLLLMSTNSSAKLLDPRLRPDIAD